MASEKSRVNNQDLLASTGALALVAAFAALASWVASLRSARSMELIVKLLDADSERSRGDASEPGLPQPSGPAVEADRSEARTSVAAVPSPSATLASLPVPGRTRLATTTPDIADAEMLRRWMVDYRAGSEPLAVFSVDLDAFDAVLDGLEHVDAQHVVDTVTVRLRSVVRPDDVVAQVEPDRFVLLCRDVVTLDTARNLAERIAMVIAHPTLAASGMVEMSASIGVAIGSSVDERPEPVVRRAVTACARARSSGRGRIEMSSIADVLPQRPARDDELAGAIARGELRVHYLPTVRLDTGQVVGFEALVRWDHPTRGLLFPSVFLADAERTGMIVPIGVWVLEEASRQVAQWRAQGADLSLAVNLSSRQLTDARFGAQLERIVCEGQLPPDALWLETTDLAVRGGGVDAEQTLRRVHDLGARVVVDDLSGGPGALAALEHLPLHAVKLDRALVAALGSQPESDAACGTLVELAHAMALCVVAEGVESLPQLQVLRAIGCQLGQGHLFGAARAAADYGAVPPGFLGQAAGGSDPSA